MDLTKLSDQEKSIMLARALGLKVERNYPDSPPEHRLRETYVISGNGFGYECGWWSEGVTLDEAMLNLYDPSNMALAWRVLNWCHGYFPGHLINPIVKWWQETSELVFLPPEKAQELWLDRILELAIEAGLVELENELE